MGIRFALYTGMISATPTSDFTVKMSTSVYIYVPNVPGFTPVPLSNHVQYLGLTFEPMKPYTTGGPGFTQISG